MVRLNLTVVSLSRTQKSAGLEKPRGERPAAERVRFSVKARYSMRRSWPDFISMNNPFSRNRIRFAGNISWLQLVFFVLFRQV